MSSVTFWSSEEQNTVLFKCRPNFTISLVTYRDVQQIEAANLNAEVRAEWDEFHSSYTCGNFGASADLSSYCDSCLDEYASSGRDLSTDDLLSQRC